MNGESESIDWIEMDELWGLSGLSQEKFCESRNIMSSTFVYHRSRILAKKRKANVGGFSRVQVMRPVTQDNLGCLVLRLPTGI